MILKAYSIRDLKSETFFAPQLDVNDETAKRNFFMAVTNEIQGTMHFAPADFQLFRIGTFDNHTGMMMSETPCVLVASGSDAFGGKPNE